jgi:N-acetylglucosaminyldiphosphoundecaprenol N-acetyl-beta-D-mannosaminyltransferase
MQPTSLALPIKRNVCGVEISATSYDEVVACCSHWIAQKRQSDVPPPSRYVCVTSVHGVMEARQDLELKQILNHADIATPDGMPVVWALRSFGQTQQQRVYGPNLMLKLCQRAAAEGQNIFLYGSTQDVIERLTAKLQSLYPDIRITGSYSPPFRALTAAEEEDIRNRIREAKADLVFVGISTPKQEKWMARQQLKLDGLIMIGVGAAFDFHAGRVRQAPKWMQDRGLEWLFRLVSEPRRLWRRYILVTPRFLPLWAMQLSGLSDTKTSR